MSRKKDSKRLQLEMSTISLDRLGALKESTDAASNAEVIRHSLRLYETLSNYESRGYTLIIRREDEQDMIFPLSIL